MQKYFPQVAQHLAKLYVFPENYCQKWFGGLCIQIMPFETLFPFFDNFLEYGFIFLFQFGLSIIEHLQDEILKRSDSSEVFALLRLDLKEVAISSKQVPNRILINPKILIQHALEFNISDVDFSTLRKELFEKHLKERLEKAKEFAKQSKEEESDEDDDEDDDGGEDCDVCHDMLPEYTCTVCNLNICEKCHEEGKSSHKKSHKVKPYEPKEDEEVQKLTTKLKDQAKI